MKSLIQKIKSLFRKPLAVLPQDQAALTKEKEAGELAFWVDVWDKNIRLDIAKKYSLDADDRKSIDSHYQEERLLIAKNQLSGLLWMAKKPEGYLDGKVVVEIGPGCCCGLDVSNARAKILIEPIAEAYRDNNLLLKDDQGAIYLTCGSEKIPLFSNYADVVIASNSLDHVEDIYASVKELHRILRPGGEFFLNLEINHEPTTCEPYALKYPDVVTLFADYDTVFIEQTTNPDGRDWVRAVFKKK